MCLNYQSNTKNGKKDNYKKIWSVYCFIKWYEIYFGEMCGRGTIQMHQMKIVMEEKIGKNNIFERNNPKLKEL